jgi:hypothetical protein
LAGLKKNKKKALHLVSMVALYYSLNGPINKKWMVKPGIRVNLAGKTKKTHIPLLEAEFAGLAECGAGKLSICDS